MVAKCVEFFWAAWIDSLYWPASVRRKSPANERNFPLLQVEGRQCELSSTCAFV